MDVDVEIILPYLKTNYNQTFKVTYVLFNTRYIVRNVPKTKDKDGYIIIL